jgi:hypothetical protein
MIIFIENIETVSNTSHINTMEKETIIVTVSGNVILKINELYSSIDNDIHVVNDSEESVYSITHVTDKFILKTIQKMSGLSTEVSLKRTITVYKK